MGSFENPYQEGRTKENLIWISVAIKETQPIALVSAMGVVRTRGLVFPSDPAGPTSPPGSGCSCLSELQGAEQPPRSFLQTQMGSFLRCWFLAEQQKVNAPRERGGETPGSEGLHGGNSAKIPCSDGKSHKEMGSETLSEPLR